MFLPHRQFDSSFSNPGLVVFREFHDKLMRASRDGHPFDVLIGGVELAIDDIVSNRPVKEKRLLLHQSDLRAQPRQRHRTDVHAVQRDRAARHVV